MQKNYLMRSFIICSLQYTYGEMGETNNMHIKFWLQKSLKKRPLGTPRSVEGRIMLKQILRGKVCILDQTSSK